jgi:hypothetical protein
MCTYIPGTVRKLPSSFKSDYLHLDRHFTVFYVIRNNDNYIIPTSEFRGCRPIPVSARLVLSPSTLTGLTFHTPKKLS